MEKLKWLWITCSVVILICTAFSITSVVLIANMAKEVNTISSQTETYCAQIDGRAQKIEQSVNIISDNIAAALTDFPFGSANDDNVDADVLFDSISIRETNGKVGIFTEDGLHIRTLDINVSTLPAADQTALKNGITINSWRELFALIEDLG